MTDLFSKTFLVDASERIIATFAETVAASVAAGALANGLNASVEHTLLIAGLAAAAATAKTIFASQVNGVSPASLLTVKDLPAKKR